MEVESIVEKVKIAFLNNWNELVKLVPDIVLAILIIALGIIVANFLSKVFRKTIQHKTDDQLMTHFLSKTFKVVLIIIVIMFALNTAGLSGIAAGMLTAAGASALIFGFAFKDLGENFLAGVILSFNRPFKMDDSIMIDNIFGKVKAMEFRYTKLKTFDGRDVYLPNSDIIKKAVYNYTEDGFIRLEFIVGIAYEDNHKEAQELILQTVRKSPGVVEDENHEAFVTLDELSASTVNMKVFFWVQTIEFRREALLKRSDVIADVKNAILANGMHLPAEIRELKLYDTQKVVPVSMKKEE
ncbi:MAG TPA: mechanosensitive ion channel family protein [Prolixibacteraceae bacterium]|nr:mechanosensitive ion channel family protein [Prolixibacteraceae bacterium]